VLVEDEEDISRVATDEIEAESGHKKTGRKSPEHRQEMRPPSKTPTWLQDP